MSSSVIVKNSVVAGKKPATAATNKVGELWVNPVDRVIGTFDAAGAPVEVGLTAAKFAVGSVPFAGADGALSQDNHALFWDRANDRLGIGTNTPIVSLDVVGGINASANIKVNNASNPYLALLQGTKASCYWQISTATSEVSMDCGAAPFNFKSSSYTLWHNGTTEWMRLTATGQLSIGQSAPDAKAKLQVDSTTQGFLPPRMTTAQIKAIATPPAGLVAYSTDAKALCFYNGTAWEKCTATAL